MKSFTLTDVFVRTAQPIGARSEFFDDVAPGLALRVSAHGRRTWCFHFISPINGKRARASIGTYPGTSLSRARGRAVEARGHVEAGHDPRMVLAGQAAAGMTVAGLIAAYLADPEKQQLRTYAEIKRRLQKNVEPIIGAVKLSELRRRDLRDVTD